MSHIWVPKFKILEGEVQPPKTGLRGFFTLQVKKADSEETVKTVGPFENLITNWGLNLIGTSFPNAIAVGSGTGSPSPADFILESYTAHSTSAQTATSQRSPDWPTRVYSSYSVAYRFDAGQATGTHAEVGAGRWDDHAFEFNTYSRARIVDSGGSPTTITVLSDEVLDVTYELRNYIFPWEDSNDDVYTTLVLSGVSYAIQMRPLSFNSANSSYGWRCRWNQPMRTHSLTFFTGTAAGTPPTLNSVTSTGLLTPGGNSLLNGSAVAYANNSYTRKSRIHAGLNDANLSYGLRGFSTSNFSNLQQNSTHLTSSWQGTITPAILKDSNNVLTFEIGQSWDRYSP